MELLGQNVYILLRLLIKIAKFPSWKIILNYSVGSEYACFYHIIANLSLINVLSLSNLIGKSDTVVYIF